MINVLIVEDDPMVASINAEYIQRVPDFFVLGIAANGKEALDILASGAEIDLLVLDVYMPQLNGLAMLEQIRRDYKGVDVIFVTAAKEKPIIQRALQLGAVDYLIKPFTFDRIRQALEKYQRRFALFSQQEQMGQEELDRMFSSSQKEVTLPKGIHPMTLEQVSRLVDQAPAGELDLSSLSAQLSITLVTLRVYLDYLTDQGRLKKQNRRGSVGRPTYQYVKI